MKRFDLTDEQAQTLLQIVRVLGNAEVEAAIMHQGTAKLAFKTVERYSNKQYDLYSAVSDAFDTT